MNLDELSEKERLRLLDEVEENIRINNTPKLDKNNLPLSAIIKTIRDLGTGLNLENACPYLRDCKKIYSPDICIGKNNYRNSSCYSLRLTSEIYNGKFDNVLEALV